MELLEQFLNKAIVMIEVMQPGRAPDILYFLTRKSLPNQSDAEFTYRAIQRIREEYHYDPSTKYIGDGVVRIESEEDFSKYESTTIAEYLQAQQDSGIKPIIFTTSFTDFTKKVAVNKVDYKVTNENRLKVTFDAQPKDAFLNFYRFEVSFVGNGGRLTVPVDVMVNDPLESKEYRLAPDDFISGEFNFKEVILNYPSNLVKTFDYPKVKIELVSRAY